MAESAKVQVNLRTGYTATVRNVVHLALGFEWVPLDFVNNKFVAVCELWWRRDRRFPETFSFRLGLGWNQIRFANSFLSLHKTFILLVLSSGSGPTYLLFPHNTDERFSSLQFIQYRPISALLQMLPFSDDPSNYFCNNSPCNRIIVCRVIRGQRIWGCTAHNKVPLFASRIFAPS